jgi:hypothetical protein
MKYLRASKSEACSFQPRAEKNPSKSGYWMMEQICEDGLVRK